MRSTESITCKTAFQITYIFTCFSLIIDHLNNGQYIMNSSPLAIWIVFDRGYLKKQKLFGTKNGVTFANPTKT